MTSFRHLRFFVFAAITLVLGACGSRQPRLATLGPDALFQRGEQAYEAGRFGRAIPPLEAFVQRNVGDPRVPRALMLLGRSHMERDEFILAASEFQRLVSDYATDPLAAEGRFGICEAYARLSPRPALDQEYTHSAILHCESVARLYPSTPQGEQAEALVADLRTKLARKAYESGLFYFKRRAYDAAVIYFTDVVNEYPRTEFAPAALMKLMESYTRIGYVEEATEARERLLREYPESLEARSVQA